MIYKAKYDLQFSIHNKQPRYYQSNNKQNHLQSDKRTEQKGNRDEKS